MDKKKEWKFRGETKQISTRLPVESINKLEALMKQRGTSKVQTLIDLIDAAN